MTSPRRPQMRDIVPMIDPPRPHLSLPRERNEGVAAKMWCEETRLSLHYEKFESQANLCGTKQPSDLAPVFGLLKK